MNLTRQHRPGLRNRQGALQNRRPLRNHHRLPHALQRRSRHRGFTQGNPVLPLLAQHRASRPELRRIARKSRGDADRAPRTPGHPRQQRRRELRHGAAKRQDEPARVPERDLGYQRVRDARTNHARRAAAAQVQRPAAHVRDERDRVPHGDGAVQRAHHAAAQREPGGRLAEAESAAGAHGVPLREDRAEYADARVGAHAAE